jgi:hypothetical protein
MRLAREYVETHDPEIPYELYKLARELEGGGERVKRVMQIRSHERRRDRFLSSALHGLDAQAHEELSPDDYGFCLLTLSPKGRREAMARCSSLTDLGV